MGYWICKLCHRRMKENTYGWFDHLSETDCPGQHAEWAEED